MIHQMRYDDCEMRSNGDGVKPIYQQREQRTKLALENLSKGMKGKLGKLSNYQFFNFKIDSIATGTEAYVEQNYNTLSTFPGNITDCVMFGSDGINGKALYYNIVYLNISVVQVIGTGAETIRAPSLVTFYLVQNINGSTTSLGTKIPQPASLHGTSSGVVAFTTSGAIYGNQRITCDIIGEQGNYYQNNDLKGIRASGLALSQILCQFDTAINVASLRLDVCVGVDISSVSSSY